MLGCALKRDLWKQTLRSCVDLCFTSISVFDPWVGKIPWRRKMATHSSWQRVCLQCTRLGFSSGVRKIPWRRIWQPHFSILAWKAAWTEEPGGLQSMGSGVIKSQAWLSTHSTISLASLNHPVATLVPSPAWSEGLYILSPISAHQKWIRQSQIKNGVYCSSQKSLILHICPTLKRLEMEKSIYITDGL